MKFSSSLEFNSVPEWRSYYIDYESLKKRIYSLERAAAIRPSASGNQVEAARLIDEDPVPIFVQSLDTELQKIDAFYKETQTKLFDRDDKVHDDIELGFDEQADVSQFVGSEPSSEDEADVAQAGVSAPANVSILAPAPAAPVPTSPRRRRRGSSVSLHTAARQQKQTYRQIHLKRALIADYVALKELESFVDLNRTGFRKIIKKFDKTLGTSLLREYTNRTIKSVYVFSDVAAEEVTSRVGRVIDEYARILNIYDRDEASAELGAYLREHVVWERNTVWRDMISLERQTHGVGQGHKVGDKNAPKPADTKFLGIQISPRVAQWIPAIRVAVILLLGLLLIAFPVLDHRPQANCLALVVVASLLWATESLPLFVTSLLVPMLVVLLRIPTTKKGHAMTAKAASEFVFSKMWSPVITVLLGGFALAAALSKYNIAKMLATMILARAGSNPRLIVLVLMFVAAFMCMWISNVAAPVLLFSVAQPLLRTLPTGDPFGKAIILGIALASNVGGMISPIASPQNIIALQNMKPEPSWGEWFAVAIPVSIISILLLWVMLIVTFPTSNASTAIGHIRGSSDRFTAVHYYILTVTGVTIALWCFSHQLEPYFGDMGVLAFFPIVFLFGPGVLSGADFNNFLWTIVALAMGGITLGKAVESCGLLNTVAIAVQAQVEGMGLFAVCAVFGLLILVIASFISHTVAALIVLPLVKSIGEQMTEPHPRIVVMVSALLCSAAMALPTSGFPNLAAICMTNEFGQPYLTVGDFITRGVPGSLIVYGVIITVGYFLMTYVGY